MSKRDGQFGIMRSGKKEGKMIFFHPLYHPKRIITDELVNNK